MERKQTGSSLTNLLGQAPVCRGSKLKQQEPKGPRATTGRGTEPEDQEATKHDVLPRVISMIIQVCLDLGLLLFFFLRGAGDRTQCLSHMLGIF